MARKKWNTNTSNIRFDIRKMRKAEEDLKNGN